MKKYSILFLVVVLFMTLSCGRLFPDKIGDIRSNPRKYAEKEVTVSGRVTEALSLIAFKYFVIRDNTGEIIIITSKPLPAVGEQLTVRGVVREAFSLGSQSAIVIDENPR